MKQGGGTSRTTTAYQIRASRLSLQPVSHVSDFARECCRSGTFLGRARVHNSGKLVDLSSALLGAGLARLHPTFQPDRQPGGRELLELEQAAKDKRLKVPTACDSHA